MKGRYTMTMASHRAHRSCPWCHPHSSSSRPSPIADSTVGERSSWMMPYGGHHYWVDQAKACGGPRVVPLRRIRGAHLRLATCPWCNRRTDPAVRYQAARDRERWPMADHFHAHRRLPDWVKQSSPLATMPWERTPRNRARLDLTSHLAGSVLWVRMLGAAAVDLAWLAEGRLDATVTLSNKTWDMAANVVQARETGDKVVDGAGHEYAIRSARRLLPNLSSCPHCSPSSPPILATVLCESRGAGRSVGRPSHRPTVQQADRDSGRLGVSHPGRPLGPRNCRCLRGVRRRPLRALGATW